MIERPIVRLIVAVAVPLATALLVEQLPKPRVAEVPFSFQVADQTLPAGNYSVEQLGLGRGIRLQNNKLGAGTQCTAARRKFGRTEAARLVFDRSDAGYQLAEVWFETDGRGLILREPSGSRETKNVWLQ
jgi:hypothetical protein